VSGVGGGGVQVVESDTHRQRLRQRTRLPLQGDLVEVLDVQRQQFLVIAATRHGAGFERARHVVVTTAGR